jgi:hypothetical protein
LLISLWDFFLHHIRSQSVEIVWMRKSDNERLTMNMTPLLNKTLKALEDAKARAALATKVAETARQTAVTAKKKGSGIV